MKYPETFKESIEQEISQCEEEKTRIAEHYSGVIDGLNRALKIFDSFSNNLGDIAETAKKLAKKRSKI